MNGAPARLSIRRADATVDVVELPDAGLRLFTTAEPWRVFRSYKKQEHFSGTYWAATMQAPVGYESRLELACLLLADFDPTVSWMLSQPFLVEGTDRGRERKHIPDYLLARTDQSLCVVDVKPASKLDRPRVRESLDWSRRVFEGRGWEYRVESEPDPTTLANIRFLAGYRRTFQFVPAEVEAAMRELHGQMSLGEAARQLTPVTGAPGYARSLVLHLLWSRRLSTPLSEPLGSSSLVEPA